MSKILAKEVKKIKKARQNYLVFVKNGYNYYVYDKDSYIISYLLDYSLRKSDCGRIFYTFQITSYKKIFEKIEEEKINYLIVDSTNGYEIVTIQDYEENNQYKEVLEWALLFVKRKEKLSSLVKDILEYTDVPELDEEIKKFEKVVKQLKTKCTKSKNSIKRIKYQLKESA